MQILQNDRLSERSQERWRARKPRGPDVYKFAAVLLSAWIIIVLEAVWSGRTQLNCTIKSSGKLGGEGDAQPPKAFQFTGWKKVHLLQWQ